MARFIEKIRSEIQDEEMELIVYKIRSYPADYTLQGLFDKWNQEEIEIPIFQRSYVWTISQASKLIESFLLGLPVPGIFLYKQRDNQKLLVVDGQQRLKTVFGYFSNQFPDSKKKFFLRDVHPQWIGKSYSDLDDADKRRLRDAVLRATVIEQLDPEDNTSIFHIFHRLNTGGTPLTMQEVRNCIYRGPFNELLKKLNLNKEYREIIGLPKPDKRMRDIELILRFIALCHSYRNYRKPMKDFLSRFMAEYQDSKAEVRKFEEMFVTTVSDVRKYLGPRCFRITAGLNAAIFDSVMVAFALNHSKISHSIKSKYDALRESEAFKELVTEHTTDEKAIKERIGLVGGKLFKQ